MLNANELLAQVPTAIIVPGTGKLAAARFPYTVRVLPSGTNGLMDETVFLGFQVMAIDQASIVQPRRGVLAAADLEKIENAVMTALGFEPPAD